MQRINGTIQLVRPKTEKSRRSLGLPEFVVEALYQHQIRQSKERLADGKSWQVSNPVYTTNATYTNTFLYGPLRPLKMHFSGMDSVHSIVGGHDNLGGDMIKNYLQRKG